MVVCFKYAINVQAHNEVAILVYIGEDVILQTLDVDIINYMMVVIQNFVVLILYAISITSTSFNFTKI